MIGVPAKLLRDPNSDHPINVGFRHGDHISTILEETGVCYSYIASADLCELFKSRLNLQLYNHIDYAPSRPSSSLEDFYADKIDVIRYLIRRYNYRTYLEIGCFQDENFANVKRMLASNRNDNNNRKTGFDSEALDTELNLGTHIVGVDPFSGGTHRMKSDDWFTMNANSSSGSNGTPQLTFDLVLVDGLHHASQALNDILNALNILNVGGTVLFHDANPNRYSYQVAPRPADTPLWNGDVWKVLAPLRLMDDLEVVVVDIDHGVGAVRRRRNRHRLDSTWGDKIQYEVLQVPVQSVHNSISSHSSGISGETEVRVPPIASSGGATTQFTVRDYRNFKCNLEGIDWNDLSKSRAELLRLMSLTEFRTWLDNEEDIKNSIKYPGGN